MAWKTLENEIAKEAYEAEKHVHSGERWLGKLGTVAGVSDIASDVTMSTFTIDGGDDTWGAWIQVFGTNDTPIDTGKTKFDPHQILVTFVERTTSVHRIQIAHRAGLASLASDAWAAGDYTVAMFISTAANIKTTPVEVQSQRITAGDKVWARCWVDGQDTGTVKFFIGIHEYDR